MSIIDARGHRVPSGTDQASRQSLLDLSLSVPSIMTVGSALAATQHVQALAAVGVTATQDRPIFVHRTDTGCLHRWDGTRWVVLAADEDVSAMVTQQPGWTLGMVHARRNGKLVNLQFSIEKDSGSAGFAAWTEYQIGTLAEGIRPLRRSVGVIPFKANFALFFRPDGAIILQAAVQDTWTLGAWLAAASFVTA